jgi:hypothetical protein
MRINKIVPHDDTIIRADTLTLDKQAEVKKSKDLRLRSLLFWDVVLHRWVTGHQHLKPTQWYHFQHFNP